MADPIHVDSTSEDSNLEPPRSVADISMPDVSIQDRDPPSHLSIPVTLSPNESNIQSPSTDGEFSEPGSPSKIESNDLESNKVFFSDPSDAFPPLTFYRMRRRLASAYFVYFLCGWGDGVTGTVLPHFNEEFHLTYMMSSLLYVVSTIGFFIAVPVVERFMNLVGTFSLGATKPSIFPSFVVVSKAIPMIGRFFNRNKHPGAGTAHSVSQSRIITLICGCILHSSNFLILGITNKFASVLTGYVIAAFSRCFLTTVLNMYVASTPRKPLGYLLGSWSFGAFVAPFVCQAVIAAGFPWSKFYLGSLVISGINLAFLIYSFRPTQAEFDAEKRNAKRIISRTSTVSSLDVVKVKSGDAGSLSCEFGNASVTSSEYGVAISPSNTLFQALSMRYQWAFSLFGSIYYGSEATFSGFTAMFLLSVRDANPRTVGYVVSGFWGGMFTSRVLWGHFSPSLGFTTRKRIIQACLCVALCLSLFNCFVDFVPANGVSSSIVGLMYGPIFPSAMAFCNELLPRKVHMVSMALLFAFAGLGSALFPLVTGLLSNVLGMRVFPYICIAQTASLASLWFLFPSVKPVALEASV